MPTKIDEQEIIDALLAEGLRLPIVRWALVEFVADEKGYGCTLTDSAAVGIGGTVLEALTAAIDSERA